KDDSFGENPLLYRLPGKSAFVLRALTYCDLHKVTRTDFLEVFDVYPEYAESFSKHLSLTISLRDESRARQYAANLCKFTRSRYASIPRRRSLFISEENVVQGEDSDQRLEASENYEEVVPLKLKRSQERLYDACNLTSASRLNDMEKLRNSIYDLERRFDDFQKQTSNTLRDILFEIRELSIARRTTNIPVIDESSSIDDGK
ncbi:hypothetical protein GJ496_005456, partial [Pomphorhynchus laevis]